MKRGALVDVRFASQHDFVDLSRSRDGMCTLRVALTIASQLLCVFRWDFSFSFFFFFSQGVKRICTDTMDSNFFYWKNL